MDDAPAVDLTVNADYDDDAAVIQGITLVYYYHALHNSSVGTFKVTTTSVTTMYYFIEIVLTLNRKES